LRQTLSCSFTDKADVEKAIGALLDHGIREQDLKVVANSNYKWIPANLRRHEADSGRHGAETPGDVADRLVQGDKRDEVLIGKPVWTVENAGKHGISTTTDTDVEEGAIKGAEIGLGIGVVGGAVAIASVPGVGAVLGIGLVAQAITVAAAGTAAGAIVGGVTGFLWDQGVAGDIEEKYTAAVAGQGAILSIALPSGRIGVGNARAILEKYGGSNISAR